jgi:hypothetical protein
MGFIFLLREVIIMTFDTRISHKIDTEENWKTNNPILLKGELIIVIDESNTVHLKIGNGTSHYLELPFIENEIVWGTF